MFKSEISQQLVNNVSSEQKRPLKVNFVKGKHCLEFTI